LIGCMQCHFNARVQTELVLFYAWQYSAAEVERYMRLASPPALVPSSDGATSSTKSAAISSTTPTPFLTTATASLTDAPKVTLIAPTATVIDVPSPAVPDNATTAAPLLPTHSTTRASKPRQAAPKKSIEQKDAPKARKRRVDVTAARTRTSKRSKKTATTDGSVPAAAAAVDGGGGTTVASDVPDQSPDRPKSAFGHLFNKPMPDATAFATTPSKSTRSTGNSLFSRAISADDDDQMMARTPPPPTSRRAALLSPVFAGGSVLLNDATQHGFFGGASTTARVTRSALFREDTRGEVFGAIACICYHVVCCRRSIAVIIVVASQSVQRA
jgi:hypothetical protein